MKGLNLSSRPIRTFSTSKPSSPSNHPQVRLLLDDLSLGGLSACLRLLTACRPDLELTNSMNEWCVNQHGKTGLTQACIDSPHTHEEVEESVRAYLEKWIPEAGAGLLAGSSVHADMRYVPPISCSSLLSLSFFLPVVYRSVYPSG